MKHLIAHRANTNGPNPTRENHPTYILETIYKKGFDVEIDVWHIDNKFFLGHDEPLYEVQKTFFNNKMWCHAKDINTFHALLKLSYHCFFHQNDDCTLTSHGWIWVYPGKPLPISRGIAVKPESVENYDISMASGICSDFVESYKL